MNKFTLNQNNNLCVVKRLAKNKNYAKRLAESYQKTKTCLFMTTNIAK